MNILVCLKQVPDTAKVKFNRETNTLDRTGVENIMNPYDRQALEVALCLKDKEGAKVTVLTMGLPQATDILKEAIAMGADDGVLLSDRVLGGSDTLATSLALAAAVKHLGEFDLVLCGKQAVDGDTAQVGPEMAEVLGIPHISWVTELIDVDEKALVVKQDLTEVEAVARIPYPCLITVEKGIFQPNLPSYKRAKAAEKNPIHTLSAAQCRTLDPARIGLSGSPTQVERIFTPTHDVKTLRLEGAEAESAARLVEILKEDKMWEEENV